ncbi:MAG: formimidoylglutamate deiminase [Rhodanobacteraceae bacterium]
MTNQYLHAADMWLDGRWQSGTRLEIGNQGRIAGIATGAPESDSQLLGKYVLPGMPNAHSHAFQRAMAGLAERRQRDHESFWSWREVMYAFAERIGPDELRAIASQLYLEMLKAGYTRVCEFHYLHRQPDGRPYADPAAMSLALVEAAREVGIGLTLLPVLYMTGGFDGRELGPKQKRFGLEMDAYLHLLENLHKQAAPEVTIGVGLHSLRAVPADALRIVLDSPVTQGMPVHIHIAEQLGEIQDCLALRNARPVEWLLDHADVNANWCLVHATHVTPGEVRRLAKSEATVGLCPTTEANLGDGLFPLADFLAAGGRIAIGSDSNVSVSPVEELRWLEYGQRLTKGKRHIASDSHDSVGETLWQRALEGGRRSSGQPPTLEIGSSADLLVLDETSPLLAGHGAKTLLDSFLFAGNTPLVRDVMVAGQWRVRNFQHADEARIAANFRSTLRQLLDH